MGKKKNIALILGSGESVRFNSNKPKQYAEFIDDILINHTIKIFLEEKDIDLILLVLNKKHKKFFSEIIKHKIIFIANGGKTRQESVLLGLKKIKKFNPINVLIHDANRPLLDRKIIVEILRKLKKYKAVIPRIKMQDTIKKIEKNKKVSALNRKKLLVLQTPQGFKYKHLLEKHLKNVNKKFTDDSSLFDETKNFVFYINGSYENLKITDKKDLVIAKNLYYSKKTLYEKSNLVGLGIDFHKFKNQKGALIICGVKIPFNKTLIAHSDGDLGYHALSDGILGAISEGDIGKHFPDTQKKNKNLNSAKILEHSYQLMKRKINGKIINIDLTFIGEEPKFLKYQKKMRENISKILNIKLNQINIKATTTEKMGFFGRKEGLGAFALININ